jgi:hypothetical protein
MIFQETAELLPLRLAGNSPIGAENKTGYVGEIEILAQQLMKIGRFLVHGRVRGRAIACGASGVNT